MNHIGFKQLYLISKVKRYFRELKSIDIDANMPTYLKKNIKKYEDWFDFDFKNI